MNNIVVEMRDLTRKFGNFIAVDHITMSIREGEIYGFLGPNGSGKSTTIKMLCGLLAPTSGEGLVLGMNLASEGRKIKHEVGYMSQKFSLYPEMTVMENLNFYSGLYGLRGAEKRERIEKMLVLSGLTGREDELAGVLSGGWRQRLALGCAILHRPKILFLDEPTSGVDPKARRLFWDIIYGLAADGTTIMVTTHFMDEAEHCDKVAFIYFGALIADDTPENLKKMIPGKLLEVEVKNGMDVLARIQKGEIGAVIDSYFFGEKLHILVGADARLEKESLFGGARIREIVPSMEDVFVYLVKEEASKKLANGRICGTGEISLKKPIARTEG